MEGLVVQVPELIGILGLVLLAYGYGYWRGVDFGRRNEGPKPRAAKSPVRQLVQAIKPHADPPPPAVTGMRDPKYTRPGVREEEL